MSDITNRDRAAWAAEAIDLFAMTTRMDGEDEQTKAKDLATNIVHFLRLECGLSFEEARGVMESAVNMAEMEMQEDSDNDDESDDNPFDPESPEGRAFAEGRMNAAGEMTGESRS